MTRVLVGVAALAAVSGLAQGVVIHFDDLPTGSIVFNQYPEATFTTIGGQINIAHGFSNGGTSAPNILCTADAAGGVNCAFATFVDFTNPVNNLTFLAVEPNISGPAAQVNVFANNQPPVSVAINGLNGAGNVLVDLSAFTNVTRIELVPFGNNTVLDPGGNGLGWDNFSFDVVPSPAGVSLLGLGGLLAARRRR